MDRQYCARDLHTIQLRFFEEERNVSCEFLLFFSVFPAWSSSSRFDNTSGKEGFLVYRKIGLHR